MRERRTDRSVRLTSHGITSLGRIRPTRKDKSRKRPTPSLLPAKLKATRERLNMSQGEIAAVVGVADRSSISGYERGEREPPLPVLLKYARVGHVNVEYFIDDEIGVKVFGPTKGT
jgi:DNA-binding XRE family transcriptional regulator